MYISKVFLLQFLFVEAVLSSFSFHSIYRKFFTNKISISSDTSNNTNISSSAISTQQSVIHYIDVTNDIEKNSTLPTSELHETTYVDDDSNIRNVVIVGSGPSGCTAAIYTSRALLKPLVLAGYQAGGQLMLTNDVENFPGYRNAISGPDMMSDLIEQAKHFGAEFWMTNCDFINTTTYPFEITLHNGTIRTKSIIIATGAESIWLNADREEEFKGKGISTCATCDGFMFRNKSVIVIGGGDSAMEEANFLTRFASSVTIIHRSSSFRASKLMLQRATNNPKITMLTHTVVDRWLGEDTILSGAVLKHTDGTEYQINCDGAFIAIGHKPMTKFLDEKQFILDGGYVVLDRYTMTNVPGIFACGDCVDKRYKQAITAAGSGCQAAIDAEKWLEEQHSS